jgi:hypothetical protein
VIVNPKQAGLLSVAMGDEEKKVRLAEALRENLRKRKAQARAQRAEDAPQRGCTQSAADSAKS